MGRSIVKLKRVMLGKSEFKEGFVHVLASYKYHPMYPLQKKRKRKHKASFSDHRL